MKKIKIESLLIILGLIAVLVQLTSNNVLGRYTSRPEIRIQGGEDQGGGAVLTYSTFEEPRVTISSYEVTGSAEIGLYKANAEDILDYLVHDKDRKQTGEVDTTKLTFVTNLTAQITNQGESSLLLPIREAGIWFLDLKLGKVEKKVFIVRSNTGVLLKEGKGQYIFWGQDFTTKKHIRTGSISVYNLQGQKKKIAESVFDGEGVAKTTEMTEAEIAIAQIGADVVLIPINLQYLGRGYVYNSFRAEKKSSKFFTFTDRPIYHPADTVFFKSIIRDDYDATYTIPRGIVGVKVYKDWDEKKVIFEKNLDISSQGTVYGTFNLPQETETGEYQLKIFRLGTAEEDKYSNQQIVNFKVEFFRKPEYSIDITPKDSELISGDKSYFKISGNYFSGQPLTNSSVDYTIYYSSYYEYEYYTDTLFNSSDYRYSSLWGNDNSKTGKAILDENGEAQIGIDTKPPGKKGKTQILTIEATFDNGSGNPVFARKNLLVYSGEFGIYRKDYGYSGVIGVPIKLEAVTINRDSKPVGGVTLEAKIHRENWVEEKGTESKNINYRKEEEDLQSLTGVSDTQGNAIFTFTPDKEGSYKITVTGKDKRGNLISKEFNYWVTPKDRAYYTQFGESELSVMKDKQKYLPGDQVNLTITSISPDRDVFLTFQREGVKSYKVISLQGKTGQTSFVTDKSDIPNIFASVSSFYDSGLDEYSENIIINSDSKKLLVTLTPDKKKYTTGETVSLNVSTTDTAGNPVSSDLAVWAVDKAIFELAYDDRAKIFDSFWQERYNATSMTHSLQGINVENPGRGGGGGGGGNARTIFKDTAYWNPQVRTDTQGRAKLSFVLPDNLTTWVVSAVGATGETLAGEVKDEIVVSKDIIVRPVVPNILRIDEKAVLSAIVGNYTAQDQDFDLNLSFNAGEVENATVSGLRIKSKETQEVFWKVVPKEENEKAKITFSAVSHKDKKLQDAIVREIPVIDFGFYESRGMVAEGAKSFPLKLSLLSDKKKTTINLSLASNVLGSLISAMKYLVSYPYGCVEQTTSRFVPAVIAKNNMDIFGEVLTGKNIEEMLQKGVARLTSLQHDDGGWGWWGSSASNSFITSYVVEYLLEAQKAGVVVVDLLNNADKYLSKPPDSLVISDDEKAKIITKKYALVLKDNAKSVGSISDFSGLTPDIVSLGVLVNIKQGDTNPETNGLSKLIAMARPEGEGLYWDAGKSENFGSIDASTSLAVRAIVANGTNREIAGKGIRYLTKNRKTDYWSNTFATAQVIRALVEYTKATQETKPNYDYTVSIDGKNIISGQVNSSKQNIPEISIDPMLIKPNGSNIDITKNGDGQIYSTIVVKEFIRDRLAQKLNHGLDVTREYVNDREAGSPLIVGDTVIVNIKVSGLAHDENYGVVQDELPVGLIPVNENLKNEQYTKGANNYYFGFSDKEYTQNGVILSLWRMGTGERVYSYKARAVVAGEFMAPPAVSSLMYSPEIYGRSAVASVKIEGKPEIMPTKKPLQVSPTTIPPKKENRVAGIAVISISGLFLLVILVSALFIISRRVNSIPKPPAAPPSVPDVPTSQNTESSEKEDI